MTLYPDTDPSADDTDKLILTLTLNLTVTLTLHGQLSLSQVIDKAFVVESGILRLSVPVDVFEKLMAANKSDLKLVDVSELVGNELSRENIVICEIGLSTLF